MRGDTALVFDIVRFHFQFLFFNIVIPQDSYYPNIPMCIHNQYPSCQTSDNILEVCPTYWSGSNHHKNNKRPFLWSTLFANFLNISAIILKGGRIYICRQMYFWHKSDRNWVLLYFLNTENWTNLNFIAYFRICWIQICMAHTNHEHLEMYAGMELSLVKIITLSNRVNIL